MQLDKKERTIAYSVDLRNQIRQNNTMRQQFMKNEDAGAAHHVKEQTAWLAKNEADKSNSRERLIRNTLNTQSSQIKLKNKNMRKEAKKYENVQKEIIMADKLFEQK